MEHHRPSHESQAYSAARPEKKEYCKPVLESHGDVRDVTLANSPRPETESGRGPGWRRQI